MSLTDTKETDENEHFQRQIKSCGPSSRDTFLRGGCGFRPAAGQLDRGAVHDNSSRWCDGAHVGIHLRRGSKWLLSDLRRVESGSGGLVARGDYGSYRADLTDQPDEQPDVWCPFGGPLRDPPRLHDERARK